MIVELLSNFFRATAEACGLVAKRSDLNNTPSQQANAEAKQIQADREKARADINNPDQTKLDEDVSP